ncbi:hypothetical protein D3C78_1635740 [compost metagenome]
MVPLLKVHLVTPMAEIISSLTTFPAIGSSANNLVGMVIWSVQGLICDEAAFANIAFKAV